MEKEKEIIIKCPGCGGTGNGPPITREMALDAGCPEMEGNPSYCLRCGGSGVDVDIDIINAEGQAGCICGQGGADAECMCGTIDIGRTNETLYHREIRQVDK